MKIDSRVINVSNGGTLVMNAGAIVTGNINTSSLARHNLGGGVRVDQNGTFIMNGGEISSSDASSGGGVRVYGVFTMNGGAIHNNSARTQGGGVYVVNGGVAYMSGGIIYRNSALDGGGVSVTGRFTMSLGEIRRNTAADNGGGVIVNNNGVLVLRSLAIIVDNRARYGGGVRVLSGGRFQMRNGFISNNRATREGGGVYNGGTLQVESGWIHGINHAFFANESGHGSVLVTKGGTSRYGIFNAVGTFVGGGNFPAATRNTIFVNNGSWVRF